MTAEADWQRPSYFDTGLAQIAARLRAGRLRASELVEDSIRQHEILGQELDAYQVWSPEQATDQARFVDAVQASGAHLAPLAGIPISVKDLFGVAGMPTYAGTPAELPNTWQQEGFLVRRVRQGMGVLVGKTRMVELAFGGLGQNPHWGAPVNPWNASEHLVPGGSSCGAGVSLWEGSAKVALGTDTACSIRVPAAMTGTVGFKPSRGRWPCDGVVPLSSSLDTVGMLTRTVADAAYFFASVDPVHRGPAQQLLRLERSSLAGLRIGIDSSHGWGDSEEGISASVMSALRELEAAGASLVEMSFPEFDEAYALYMEGTIVPPEAASFLHAHLPGWLETLDARVGQRLLAAERVSATEYLGALHRRQQLIELARGRMQAVDLLATPTVPISPPHLSDLEDPEVYTQANRLASRCTNPANILDLCAISLPCGLDQQGMPVGLQLLANAGDEEPLLAYAYRAECQLGTAIDRLGVPPRCRGRL